MRDDWITPNDRPAALTPRARAGTIWRVTRDGHVMSCELRDQSRSGAGWGVLLRQDDELLFLVFCEDQQHARVAVAGLKRDQVKAGWTEQAIEKGDD